MTNASTPGVEDFRNHPDLKRRQRQYFIGILEKDAAGVMDALGEKGGFVDEKGDVLQGSAARDAVEEIFGDGGLEYFDVVIHEGVAFASFRGAVDGRACWVETDGSLTEYPVSS